MRIGVIFGFLKIFFRIFSAIRLFMRIWVPGGKKERFQRDISGPLLPPVIGIKRFIHLTAKSTFLLLFYRTCFNRGTDWPKPLLGRFMVCPSLWSPFYSWCLFVSEMFILLMSPWLACLGRVSWESHRLIPVLWDPR